MATTNRYSDTTTTLGSNGNVVTPTTATRNYVIVYVAPFFEPFDPLEHVGRGAAELAREIARFGKDLLWVRCRKAEANRSAMADARSRERRPPQRGFPPAHRRLQTYNGAMAARVFARRTA